MLKDRVFAGDALLIEGCGRTDFQNGNANDLYRSVTENCLPCSMISSSTPAHDSSGRRVSSSAQEQKRNPRLGQDIGPPRFCGIIATLNLPQPKSLITQFREQTWR
jgi:sulfur dioxygenase